MANTTLDKIGTRISTEIKNIKTILTNFKTDLWNNTLKDFGVLSPSTNVDLSLNTVFKGTLGSNVNLNLTNASSGNVYVVIVTQDAIGNFTVGFTNANVKIKSGSSLDLGASKVSIFTIIFDGTNFLISIAKGF